MTVTTIVLTSMFLMALYLLGIGIFKIFVRPPSMGFWRSE